MLDKLDPAYEAFGDAWAKEIAKFKKEDLIVMLQDFGKRGKEAEALLLDATKNLGHPAYEHSSLTHEYIDNLRERCFDFLGVPKE